MPKQRQEVNVYEATVQRIRYIFSQFKSVYLSFSGGKDSGLLLHLVLEEARKLGRLPLSVFTIDHEAEYQHSSEYVMRMLSRDDVKPYWICLPIRMRNATSQYEAHWQSWDPDKKDSWIKSLPNHPSVISNESFFPWFYRGMDMGIFMGEFGEWFAQGEDTACLVAIRADESLNRYRTIKMEHKDTWKDIPWSTQATTNVYNFYPIYDWTTEDIWVANGKFGFDYNRIYDLMYTAGIPLSKMRICQPYGDDQRQGLYLFKILEPETWNRIVARVEGANFGNRHVGKKVCGDRGVVLPQGYTYKRFAKFLLNTMPPYLAEHYRRKIHHFLNWWRKNGPRTPQKVTQIFDVADPKLEAAKRVPSWRRIVKCLLRNDYWCRSLSFGPTMRDIAKQLEIVNELMEVRSKNGDQTSDDLRRDQKPQEFTNIGAC